jgi:predicted 2-oxoglutarate/Fe(II)-dependent dioxygenase YbiX
MKYNYFYHDSFFSVNECNSIRQQLQLSIDNNIVDQPAAGVEKTSTVKFATYGSLRSHLYKLNEFVTYINKNHFGFDLFNVSDSDTLLYNVYNFKKLGKYDWHQDSQTGECYDYKLTVLVNLSQEPYKGGEFELFLNGGATQIPAFDIPGSICIFPSWTYHRVLPVTAGERISMSQFYSGPNIR